MRTITVDGITVNVPYTGIPQRVRISRLPDGTHETLIWPVTEPEHLSATGGAVTVADATIIGAGESEIHEGASVIITDATAEDLLSVARTKKKAEIAAARYTEEIAGVSTSGSTIATDRESQALVTGAAFAASLDASYTLNWKTEDGFVLLNAAQVIAVAQAVRAHVQAAFDKEATLRGQIDMAETVEAVEAIAW